MKQLTSDQIKNANKIANLIENDVTTNKHLLEERNKNISITDEELLYSAVEDSG